MPISALTNISVPIDGDNQALLMPKLQYRFRVIFDGLGGAAAEVKELTKQVVDVTRPNLTFENIVLDVYNSKANIAGKHTWEPVTLTLRDDVNNGVQKVVGQQLQRQFDFWEQASAGAASSYKFKTSIQILDGGNGSGASAVVLDQFVLVGCYLESVNYNSLNYATNEAVTVTLSIRYDNAIQYGRSANGEETVTEGPGDRSVTTQRLAVGNEEIPNTSATGQTSA